MLTSLSLHKPRICDMKMKLYMCVFGLGGKSWNWQRRNQTEPKRNQRRLCRGGQELEQKQQR